MQKNKSAEDLNLNVALQQAEMPQKICNDNMTS